MKKTLLLLLSAMFISCGSSKIVRQSQKAIKGEWTLNSINYSETGTYNVVLLDDASKDCFEQSTWRFTPNNNTGSYNIDKSTCSTGDRNFKFTIQETEKTTGLYSFLLKPTNAKRKSESNKGFRLNLTQLSENSMQWKQTVMVEGKSFTINMNFIK